MIDIPYTPAGHGGHLAGYDEHDKVSDAEHLHVDGLWGPRVRLLRIALEQKSQISKYAVRVPMLHTVSRRIGFG